MEKRSRSSSPLLGVGSVSTPHGPPTKKRRHYYKTRLMLEEGAMKELTEKIKSAKEELRKYEKELAKANKRLDESGTEQPANLRDAVTLIYSMLATIQSRITEHEKEYSKHKTAIAEYLAEFEQMSSESEEDVRTRNFEMKPPRSLERAPSSASLEDIQQRMTPGDIYHHWFAVALYDLKQYLLLQEKTFFVGNNVEFPFLDIQMSIRCSQLNLVVDEWLSRRTNREKCCTSALHVELEHFLFPRDGRRPLGGCYHEMLLAEPQSDHPDFCVLPYPMEGGCREFNKFVAIADFKADAIKGIAAAEIESMAYTLRGQKDCLDYVRLVFPCTPQAAKLFVNIPQDKSHLTICVFESSPLGKDELEIFLCMLYAGVHYLLQSPIQSTVFYCPEKRLNLFKLFEKSKRSCSRVLFDHTNSVVYKLFDIEKNKPNLEVVQIALSGTSEKVLSKDGRYRYLTYDFLDGNHKPVSVRHFCPILNQLHKIHEKGYVHSDIRETNLVFHPNGATAMIIDFDLADKEGVPYPGNYNHRNISERHPDARAMEPREKVHDVYALNVLMKNSFGITIMEEYDNGKTLAEIAAACSN